MAVTKLTIFHYNDLHSKFDQWPKLVSFLEERRTDDTLYFDLGDHADRTHPATEVTRGKLNVRLLERLQPTAVTIGNNEGITFPHDWLADLYEEATFPILLGNVYEADGSRPDWVEETLVLERDGLKIGLFGVTAPYEELYPELGWQIESPYEATKRALERLAHCDVIIALSHLGFFGDERLADMYPDIDVILGAHTHHVLDEGVTTNGVLIAQAGKYGKYVGEVTLTLDESGVVSKEARLHELSQQSDSPDTLALLDTEGADAERLLDITIAETEGYASDWFGHSPLSELLVEGMVEWCAADVGIIPSGVVLDGLAPGKVTLNMLHRICPHPINPCVLTLDGKTLERFLHDVNEETFTNMHVRGLGFRGTVLGEPSLYQIEQRDGQYYVMGEKLEPNRTYRVATVDMLTFGPLLPYLADQPKRYFMPELLRDVLRETIVARHEVIRKG
ncbi:bifunctional metallophosphatase/5'-nucleotidase [Exiguobacterium sp. B2(2022)]|uniref:bifunctional metallophosphatase/5'-nucleotidase n=1 Tax=Exiguobacterium sp. B2(2022) TaxID=2992755 RepID=UPI00237C3E47|nr:bifunctional UDP-sugar hydrolase/5'-nucleotidase [Exiguobacterium sp. B2(2022)]MDE0562690.1 bifunctional metallophosphatase/5'-nucleotidase [Exiguobacterium sp. B2(2022)]